MEDGHIQFSQGVQGDNRVLKELPIASILAPFVVMVVDCLPGNLFPVRLEFIPLHPRPQDIQNVVEDFVVGYLWLAALGFRKAWFDKRVELILTDFPG